MKIRKDIKTLCSAIVILGEVIRMATKSILKDVTIKEKRLAHSFVEALEQAENSKFEPTGLRKTCKELTGEKVKMFFGKR